MKKLIFILFSILIGCNTQESKLRAFEVISDFDGQTATLSDLDAEGNVLIYLFDYSCIDCVADLVLLDKGYKKLQENYVLVIGINDPAIINDSAIMEDTNCTASRIEKNFTAYYSIQKNRLKYLLEIADMEFESGLYSFEGDAIQLLSEDISSFLK